MDAPASSTTRRAFLRILATSGLGAWGLTGCELRDDPQRTGMLTVTRPIVRIFGSAAVWIEAFPAELPVAYVSMAARQVYVDAAYRDRVSWLLDAHISVSTALWRIPLPGDSPLTPIPPGDEAREFEERPMGAWDPGVVPGLGDIRIVRGRRVRVEIPMACVPVSAGEGFLSADRLRLERGVFQPRAAGEQDTVREDVREVGAGRHHRDRECGDEGVAVDLISWSAGG